MGKKKAEAPAPKAAPEPKEEETVAEDPPIVKELKALDDQFVEIEREYRRKIEELQKQFAQRQTPLLSKRTELLVSGVPQEGNEATPLAEGSGTPALKDFWVQALENLPPCAESIEEWDKPVLSYLRDITKELIEAEDNSQPAKGFRLKFTFVENPYFTNLELVKEYFTKEESPFNTEITVSSITATEIEWKAGKDVTVETVKSKPKGATAKKSKGKAKEKEEPRDSFFRIFFQNLKEDEPVPDGISCLPTFQEMVEEEDDDEQAMEMLMENDYETGCAIRDMVIPNAIRWYTGEAFPNEDDSDDEDEESEEEDSEEDSEDEPPRRGGKGGGKGAKKPAKKDGPVGNADGAKEQECKQQ